MQDYIYSGFFGILTVAFAFLTYVILRKGINEINLTFAVGTISLAIASFICMLAFGNFVPEGLGPIFVKAGNTMMFLAPIAFFYSGFIIIYGQHMVKSIFSVILIAVYAIITLYYWATDYESLDRGLFAGVLVISFGLILVIIIFSKVYSEIPEQRNNLTFLIGGMAFSLIALLVHAIDKNDIFMLPMEVEALPGLLINLGIFVTALAFTTLPNRVKASPV